MRQAAARRLLQPALRVAITIENDALVCLQDGLQVTLQLLMKIRVLHAGKEIGHAIKGLCHNHIENDICPGTGLA